MLLSKYLKFKYLMPPYFFNPKIYSDDYVMELNWRHWFITNVKRILVKVV